MLISTNKFLFVPCSWQDDKHLSLFLYRAQNLPSLLFNLQTLLSTLLILMQDARNMNFVMGRLHRGVFVAQWWGIGARNQRVWGSIPHEDSEFLLCSRSWQDQKHLSLEFVVFDKFTSAYYTKLQEKSCYYFVVCTHVTTLHAVTWECTRFQPIRSA